MASCSKCPTEILFVQMIKADASRGKVAPVDAVPSTEGNIRVTRTASEVQARVLAGEDLAFARSAGEELHVSHFVTCPAAKSFRRK